ncbi:unnamed protein product, partial [Laminaria digitata]
MDCLSLLLLLLLLLCQFCFRFFSCRLRLAPCAIFFVCGFVARGPWRWRVDVSWSPSLSVVPRLCFVRSKLRWACARAWLAPAFISAGFGCLLRTHAKETRAFRAT